MDIQIVSSKAQQQGLLVRGGFDIDQDDAVPVMPDGSAARTLVLLGNAGSSLWPVFSSSEELRDGLDNPLDRWSKRVGDQLARELGGIAYYPFGGPPYQPFIRWAKKAEALHSSKLNLIMHPTYGLWHAYRLALVFSTRSDTRLQLNAEQAHACDSCQDQPCYSSCPVGAFADGQYDVDGCVSYLNANPQAACHHSGCIARMSCPEGEQYRYQKEHAAFHMREFVKARLIAMKIDNE